MQYSMKDLQEITGKTPQSIRQVMVKAEEVKSLLEEHKHIKPNKSVVYDECILNALLDYYGIETTNDTDSHESIDSAKRIEELEELLLKERAEHTERLKELEEQLKTKEAERIHFINENSKLTALLLAEKQEKQKLLPAPKQSTIEKIKRFFLK